MVVLERILVLLVGFLMKRCSAVYIVHPKSLNTSIKSTVELTCEAVGGVSLISFYVEDIPAVDARIVSRGFEELGQDTINGTIKRKNLLVFAQKINNNTNIYCIASPGYIKSDTATLRIQGKVMYWCIYFAQAC